MSEYLIGKDLTNLETRVTALEEALSGRNPRLPRDPNTPDTPGGQLLINPGFEDSIAPSGWSFRCTNLQVYRPEGGGQSGRPNDRQYLAVNDEGGDPRERPSIFQDVLVSSRVGYDLDFQIWARAAAPIQRRIQLVLRKRDVLGGGYPVIAESDAFDLTTSWNQYQVIGRSTSGGRWRCEIYWADQNPIDINFDNASLFARPL
ncbi:MAG: hypothetical protein QNJ33_20965 [Crocosphaera sp.]|nr:hypothetical protein [Crocosphaera sp.]